MASEHLTTTQLSSSVVGTCVLSYIKLVMCLVACPYRTCRTIPPTTPIFRCDHWGQVNREAEMLRCCSTPTLQPPSSCQDPAARYDARHRDWGTQARTHAHARTHARTASLYPPRWKVTRCRRRVEKAGHLHPDSSKTCRVDMCTISPLS